MPGKEMKMFGRMTVDAMVTVGAECEPLAAVKAMMEIAEKTTIVKWIEFPDSVLLFVMIPGDPNSGTVYVLDRKPGVWYWIDFEDSQYGGYTLEELERLVGECNLLNLVERPALLRSGLRWVIERGQAPVARA
jgi:hypothetical protein